MKNYVNVLTKTLLIKEYLQKKRSCRNISRDFGCVPQTVGYYLDKYSIKKYSRSELQTGIKKGKMKPEHRANWKRAFFYTIALRNKKLYFKYKKQWDKISEIDWAWITGFWEGEGFIATRNLKLNKRKDFRMCVTQKDKSPLLYMQKLLKTGNIYKQNNCFSYRINKLALSSLFIDKITPYLKSNRRLNQIKELKKHDLLGLQFKTK